MAIRPDPSNVSSASEIEITLAVLNAVQENPSLTQRSVAQQLGLALGLVNAYVKRCVTKGYVKIRQVPRRRYAYYLTPTGFTEKRRLTAEYLKQSFKFVRSARDDCARVMESCAQRQWHRIMLCGLGDFSDIALLCARDAGVEIVGVIDDQFDAEVYHGIPVHRTDSVPFRDCDAIIITDVNDAQLAFDTMAGRMPLGRVLALQLLGVAATPLALVE